MNGDSLPDTWRTARLGEIAEISGGGTPSRDVARYFTGNILWATPTDVTALDDLWIGDTAEKITEEALQNSSAKMLPAGTVLMTSRATIGATAIARHPICTNQGFANFVCKDGILHNEYLAYWLPYVKERLIQLAGGSTFKEIAKSTLAKVEIPLPTLPEQRRIVEILRQADDVRRLRRRSNERAQELLPALFNEMFGDPATNPKGWPVTTLGEIGGPGQYGLNAAAISDDSGVRFVRITDIDPFGKLYGADPAYVPKDILELDKYQLKYGDILIARSGATAGKSYLHQDVSFRSVFAGYLIRFKIDQSKALPEFVASFLQTPEYWRQLNSHKRAVAQPNVNAKQLASIYFPLPPLSLQRAFAERGEKIRRIKEQQLQSQERFDGLFQSLLAQAFSGELTSAWREAHRAKLIPVTSALEVITKPAVSRIEAEPVHVVVRHEAVDVVVRHEAAVVEPAVSRIEAEPVDVFVGQDKAVVEAAVESPSVAGLRDLILEAAAKHLRRYWTLMDLTGLPRLNNLPRNAVREAIDMLVVLGQVRQAYLRTDEPDIPRGYVEAYTLVRDEELIKADEIEL